MPLKRESAAVIGGITSRERGEVQAWEVEELPPRTRGECVDGQRPCPWVRCKYHLALHVGDGGGLAYRDLCELEETCALDVADSGPHTMEEIAGFLGTSKQRVDQVEKRAFAHARRVLRSHG